VTSGAIVFVVATSPQDALGGGIGRKILAAVIPPPRIGHGWARATRGGQSQRRPRRFRGSTFERLALVSPNCSCRTPDCVGYGADVSVAQPASRPA